MNKLQEFSDHAEDTPMESALESSTELYLLRQLDGQVLRNQIECIEAERVATDRVVRKHSRLTLAQRGYEQLHLRPRSLERSLRTAVQLYVRDREVTCSHVSERLTRLEIQRYTEETEDAESAGYDPDRYSGSRY